MVFKRAERLRDVQGFGIDRTAVAADARTAAAAARDDWPVLRMENLDTDLPLPPEPIPETVRGLETAEANSWLPFTGDMDLRAAISDFLAERTGRRYDPEREILVTSGGTEALLDIMLATVDPGDEVLLTDPTYAGIVNRARLAGGVPLLAPYAVDKDHQEWRLDLDAFPAAAAQRPALAELVESVGWMHVYNPTTPTGIARAAATAVLRGDQGHVADAVADLERRRDTLLDALEGWPVVRPAGGWSMLIDAEALGTTPAELSRALLDEAAIAATPMTGWGGEVAGRPVRLGFSAEPVERLATLPQRFAGTPLEAYGSSAHGTRT